MLKLEGSINIELNGENHTITTQKGAYVLAGAAVGGVAVGTLVTTILGGVSFVAMISSVLVGTAIAGGAAFGAKDKLCELIFGKKEAADTVAQQPVSEDADKTGAAESEEVVMEEKVEEAPAKEEEAPEASTEAPAEEEKAEAAKEEATEEKAE